MLPSYSTKTTKSETTETMNGHVGSNINVGGGLSISAGQKAGVLDEESDDAEPTELVVGNINIEGSTIAAGGDLNLLSTGTIDILSKKTTVETNETVSESGVWYKPGMSGESTKVTETLNQASLTSGGIMRVDGDEGVSLTSAKLDMADGGYIRSTNGDVSSSALYLKNAETFNGKVGKRKVTKIAYSDEGQATEINAGDQGFSIESKGDIALEGAKIKSSGDVTLESKEGNIELTGIKNTEYDYTRATWSKSGFVTKTKYEAVDEHFDETVDRTTIEGATYSARAGTDVDGGMDLIKQGTTITAGTIYEGGRNNIEKTMEVGSLDYSNRKKSTSFDIGVLKIKDVHKTEDEARDRATYNEVNENYASGEIVKEFTGSVLLEGSEIASSGGPVSIIGADVNLAAVKDMKETYRKQSESGFAGVSFSADGKKAQAGVSTHYEGTTDTTYTYDETARGVNIVGEGVTVKATNGTLQGQSTYMNSGNGLLDVNGTEGNLFTEAKERHFTETSHSDDKIEVRAYIGNKWAETAIAAVDQMENGDALTGASMVGSLSSEIAESAQTAATFGFYGGVETTKTEDKTTVVNGMDVGVGATFVSNGGMNFESANGDIDLIGATAINTGGDVTFKVNKEAGKSVNLLAGETDVWGSTKSESKTDVLNVETNILGHYGGDVSHSESGSKTSYNDVINQNTLIINTGGTTTYEAGNLNLEGAESYAKVQDLSKVNNVTIASQQDEGETDDKSSSYSVNASYSVTNGANAGASFNQSEGSGDSNWTNSRSVLAASDDIVGKIENLNLTASDVYVQSDLFDVDADSGEYVNEMNEDTMTNMSLDVGQLHLEDLKDSDKYDSTGYGVSVSTGGSESLGERQDGSISAEWSGYEKEAISKSYIGKGLLKSSVGDGSVDVSGEGSIATSIEDRQEITKDDSYSEGFNTKVVTDALTYVDRRQQEIENVKNGVADAGQAAHRIGDAAQDVGAVAKGVSSGEMSMSEGIGLYGEAAELRDNTKVFQEEYEELTQKLNEGLGDGSVGEKGMQDTIVEATNVIQDQQGVEEGNQGEMYIYDGSGTAYKGFRDKETDDIGINVGEGGTNLNDGSETYSVMVHEVSHQNGADETKAHFLTDVAADSWNTENQFNGNETNTSKVNQGEWLNNQTTDSDGNRTADSLINQNTIKASQVDEFDPYKWKTGEVEKGDTLTSITKEVNYNYGTNYEPETIAKINKIEDLDKIQVGEKVQVGTIDENGKIWKPPYEEGLVNPEYFKELDEDQQKITHYHRNTFADEDIPKTIKELEKNESENWKYEGEAAAHNIGTEGNKDYRGKGPRSNQQAIYDKKGNLVTTPENGASYDFVSPKDGLLGHADVDVEPWLKWGNSPQDIAFFGCIGFMIKRLRSRDVK